MFFPVGCLGGAHPMCPRCSCCGWSSVGGRGGWQGIIVGEVPRICNKQHVIRDRSKMCLYWSYEKCVFLK